MRFPGSRVFRREITSSTALIRELHVYGKEAVVGSRGTVQHRGLGTKLLEHAEDIAKQNGMDKVIVISGSGARPFYYKHGYARFGPYVGKSL